MAIPVASGTTVTRAAGASIQLSSLFTYSDLDNDIVSFAVRDRELGGGYLTRNGVRQTENVLIDPIPIGEIGLWAFVAGPAGSTSTIGFNANDSLGGFNPSAVSTVIAAAAVNNVPTASGTTLNTSAGVSTPLSALFSFSDLDNDIVSFAVRDRELGGGYLTRNSVRQAENTLFDPIPIGEIGLWAFVAGPAGSTSTIGFNANDSHGAFSPSVSDHSERSGCNRRRILDHASNSERRRKLTRLLRFRRDAYSLDIDRECLLQHHPQRRRKYRGLHLHR